MAASTDELVDLLVVGAGPAGCTAALSALQRHPGAVVRLLDAAQFPRDKACGDGIAPHALAELESLGVRGLTRGHDGVPGLDLVSPGGVRVRVRPPRPGYVIPRRVFDDRLLRAAVAAGAQLVRHRVRSVSTTPDRVLVDGEHAGRVLVAADGANSVVRRALGIRRNPDPHLAVAVRGYAAEHPQPAGGREQLIRMQERAWPAYAWSFPLADGSGRANVGYGRLRSQLSGRQDLHGELARLLPGQPAEDLRAHHLPLSTWRPRQPDGRVLLAGDAASLINPLTGEGIFYAVRSGRLAGAAAVSPGGADAGRAYRRALRQDLGAHLRDTRLLALAAAWPGVPDSAFEAAATRPALIQALVELGLADGRAPAAMVPAVLAAHLRRRWPSGGGGLRAGEGPAA